jgi:hypothetical protein
MLTILPFVLAYGDNSKIQNEFNQYFEKLSLSFDQIANSQSLKNSNLGKAEKLFLKEMRRNLAYNTFLRTNSKGQIISEAIRGNKIERPLRDVSSQAWFKKVKSDKEEYYDLIKDKERGRYYLLWAKPILNAKGLFVGAVVAKLDIWDCFYDFSENVYYPFMIKLNGIQLFVHKWKKGFTGEQEMLTVSGAKNVSLFVIPEEKPVDTVSLIQTAVKDLDTTIKKVDVPDVKKQKSSTPLFIIIISSLVALITGSVLLGKHRQKEKLRKIDDDTF